MSELLLYPILNRIDALIQRIDKLLEAYGVPTIPPAIAPVVITEPKRNNRYHGFTIDTSVARDNEPLGLPEILKKHAAEYATYMVILALGGGFSYRVNDKAASIYTASVGEEWSEFEIEEIYITNAAVAGTAEIHIEWRAD